jgi:hypothetical protein
MVIVKALAQNIHALSGEGETQQRSILFEITLRLYV